MNGDVEALAEVLALLPTCTQCGKPFGKRACGITHAIIATDPLRHRVFGPLVAARVQAARADELESLDDSICGAIMAEKHGSYDGLPVERHLAHLLNDVRARVAALRTPDAAPEEALPQMLADRGCCLTCGTTMRDCAFGSARVCCRKCEHARVIPPVAAPDLYDGWKERAREAGRCTQECPAQYHNHGPDAAPEEES